MLKNKRILVVGGSGSIGGAVVEGLPERGARVFASARTEVGAERLILRYSGVSDVTVLRIHVLQPSSQWGLDWTAFIQNNLDGIVYAVGDCPPRGFDNAIKHPLNALSGEDIKYDLELHCVGFQNLMREALPVLGPSASVVAVSSAITRLTDKDCPSWLYAGHYAAATAAKDELVRWWRRDPKIQKKGVKIHRIAFGAVDTPFHKGSIHKPPALIPLKMAAGEIIAALESDVIVDKTVMALQ